MKRKTTNLIGLLLMTTMFVWGQTTHMVTSNADSGENTLRQIVEDAQGGDSIVISTEIAEIVLQSEISASKNLSINGQGATVKVAEAGVSPYRVLNFSFAEGNEGEVALYNLTLIGGDISGNGNFDIGKGGALFVKRTHLKLKNCFLNYGKAYNGGGLANGEGSFSLVIDSCYFSGNIGTNGHCAASLSFAGGMQIKNSVFEDNGTTAISMTGSGIDITQPGTISNCVFRANKTNGGRGGAALSVRNSTGTVYVENTLFDSNTNNGTDGGPAMTRQNGGAVVMTNCTFYKNIGGRGAVYVYAGEVVLVNNSFAGNKEINGNANYGGAFYARTDGPTIVTLVNNIFAYNYKSDGNTRKDVFCASGGNTILSGSNNLIAVGQNVSALTNAVSFVYNAENDPVLFENYTTNNDGKIIPVLDTETGTIPLFAVTSIAISAGTTSFSTVTIPTVDQRGETRDLVAPSIGSYEYIPNPTTQINETKVSGFNYWSIDGTLTIVSNKIQKAYLYTVDGRLNTTLELNEGLNTITGIVKGFYILNNQKIMVR